MTNSQTIADEMLASVEGWTPKVVPQLPELTEDPQILTGMRLSDFRRAYDRVRNELKFDE